MNKIEMNKTGESEMLKLKRWNLFLVEATPRAGDLILG